MLFAATWIDLEIIILLLSRFSRVRLCATPQTAAHQAPSSLGFSRQEHWSGLPFPSPMHESEVAQSFPTLSDPMDCSLPVSSVHGFSRQEYWSGVPLPSPIIILNEVKDKYMISLTWLQRNFIKQKQSHRHRKNLWLPKGLKGRGINQEFGINRYTHYLIYTK